MSESVRTPTAGFRSAVGWSFVMNTIRLFATIGTSILLAALLGPRSFGVVALALIYVTLLQALMEQGFMAALIQRPDLTKRHLDSAFWVTMTASLILTLFSLIMAGWWSRLNGAPEARAVVWALSTLLIARGLVIVQEALLRRQMRFRELAIRTTIASTVGAAVGISWALIEPSLWALVAQQLTTAIVGAVVLWTVSDWRPRFSFWATEARQLLPFAAKSSLSGLGVFVNNRVDTLLVGVYFGPTAIGLYRLAARLVESAIEFTVQPIQNVALPEFSRHAGVQGAAAKRYCSLALISIAVGVPVMATVFAAAQPLMVTIGDEWTAAVTALQLLTIVGVVRTMTMLNSAAVQAAGRPGSLAFLTWFAAALSAGSFVLTGMTLQDEPVNIQVAGMAASRAILYALVLLPIVQIGFTSRIIGVSTAAFTRLVSPTLAVGVATAVTGAICSQTLLDAGVPSPIVLVLVGAGVLAGSAGLTLLVNAGARNAFASLWPKVRLVVTRGQKIA